ncbi:ketopantoate reductase family protein [Marinobacter sp. LV10MA510-1]|uniref:ketopantoate reductase family protein n=1 Tax=Marinobacter sp. LV10MA510-1 TaxID=1415567 RepID=UPI000C001755|nr:ketopantoate reductase family protein [Marinobacter sp. LV10MA510-1]PFG10263.1 2-dehydropantoate 2-reductase [Marinobacter sp. LV10MA510-1]
MLKLLMIGAGGIGGYYAARLARAGHDVVLTARGEHLHAIKNRGLTVRYGGDEWNCRLPVFDHAHLLEQYRADDFDLVLVALKSTATESVLHELGSWLGKGSVAVLSLQNGVDNEPIIAAAIGSSRTLGGLAVRIGGHIVEPGVIEAEGVGQVVMGEWPEAAPQPDTRRLLLKTLETAFNESGIPATVSPRICYELWRKLVINNGVNPLSALTGLDTRSLTQHPKFGKLVYAMMSETVAASRADGVNLGQQDLDEMFELISSFNAIKTSMLVDKEKGRPLELDSIAGAVLRRSEALGIGAPYTAIVSALLEHGLG